MDHAALLSRIMNAVDDRAYLTPTAAVDPTQKPVIEEIRRRLRASDFDAGRLRTWIARQHDEGRLDRVHMLSALHVVAAHPKVNDFSEAARLAGEQELAALELGGPHLEANLASVDRHRGVLAFLRRHYGVALDHFTRALERQRTPENVGNVLASLLRLGELEEAEAILAQVRRTLSPGMVAELDHAIASDPDLASLRPPEAP
ncbi:MAG: hypothetical protein H6733_12455 [Alphaproteobacteria bacterium]|nr:hypothetical protein [Alphaproteobacteria bacterium]